MSSKPVVVTQEIKEASPDSEVGGDPLSIGEQDPIFTVDSTAGFQSPAQTKSVGIAGFSGSISVAYFLSDRNNKPVSGLLLKDFVNGPEPLILRLRSNDRYALFVETSGFTETSGFVETSGQPEDTAPGSHECDIVWDVRVLHAGAGVVGPRYDLAGARVPRAPSLCSTGASNRLLLAGSRISASGDNSSDDNYLEFELRGSTVACSSIPDGNRRAVTLTIAPRP